jgi:hypothetical protein
VQYELRCEVRTHSIGVFDRIHLQKGEAMTHKGKDMKNEPTKAEKDERRDANRDPITKAPGSHPVGTAAGAASGAAAGAAVGTAIGGPVGFAAGGVVGAVAGAVLGHGIAEAADPTIEDAYWRKNYSTRPYAKSETYDHFRPAYRHGWEERGRHGTSQWSDVEKDLQRDWEENRSDAEMSWDDAKPAVRDAWDRGTVTK